MLAQEEDLDCKVMEQFKGRIVELDKERRYRGIVSFQGSYSDLGRHLFNYNRMDNPRSRIKLASLYNALVEQCYSQLKHFGCLQY